VVAALGPQLESWRDALAAGAQRVGWKIGLNIPEVQARLGIEEPVIGHLTSASQLGPGEAFDASGTLKLHGEPEIALELGRPVDAAADPDSCREAIAGLAPAIELVDLDRPPEDLEPIVGTNVFHRAFALAPSRPALVPPGTEAAVSVNGELRATAAVPQDFADVVSVVARLLGASGERLEAGDRIIAGSLVPPLPLARGDRVSLEAGELGSVEAAVAT
jgi:2-keto-4-pentenoate hydratase